MAWVGETEAVPRHVYSSSSARCFDHICGHDLCNINGYLESVLNKKALKLSDLTLPPEGNDYTLDLRDNASPKDMYVGEYVKHLIPPDLPDVKVSTSPAIFEIS